MADEIPPGEVRAQTGRLPADLGVRLLSAVAIAAVTVLLAYAGAKPFALLVLVAALAMSWEWGSIVRRTDFDLTFFVHAAAVVLAAGLTAFGYAALGVAVLVIGAIIVLPLEFGEHPITSATGVLYTGLPAVALLWFRGDDPKGFLAVLFIFIVVGATDTFAFLAGKTIGGPKLAPAISPNKTWSGLAGGVTAAAITAAVFAVLTGTPVAAMAVYGLALGLLAQAGDLAESVLKRAFGVKDSSNLIPGHGGVMDRVDGVVAASIAAAVLALFTDAHAPAQALFAGF